MSRPVFCDPYSHQAGGVRAELVPTIKGNTLHVTTFACGRCHQASQQSGSAYLQHRGIRMHVCATCRNVLRERALRRLANPSEVTP